jgi:hypothetical protein
MQSDDYIRYASVMLPFINEMSIVLTNSGFPMFKDLYKVCIPKETLEKLPSKYHHDENLVCSMRQEFRKIVIDMIAYLGIMLNIGRNTLNFGYFIGVVNGLFLVFFSMIVPSLFLSRAQKALISKLAIGDERRIARIILGLACVILLMYVTDALQERMQKSLQKYIIIDAANEKE